MVKSDFYKYSIFVTNTNSRKIEIVAKIVGKADAYFILDALKKRNKITPIIYSLKELTEK